MKIMKILFTSVGRRVELLQAYRAAAQTLGISLELWGADITNTAPATVYCDRFYHSCRISEPDYIPALAELCEREHIDALIPTIDTDLLVLAKNKQRFAEVGTRVIVSDEAKIKICRDKTLTADFFAKVGLKSPRPTDDYTKYNEGYPAFIKPRDGSSSIFAYKVENAAELKAYAAAVPDYIVQKYVEGTEYTVDILCDFEGNPVYITPRVRLAVRSGEVSKTEIDNDERIIGEIKQLLGEYKPCGPITVQLIRTASGEDYYIEINPRYGGGAPLSIKAGADSAEAIIRLVSGESVAYRENAAANHSVYSRFDQSVIINNNAEALPVKAVVFDLDDTLFDEKEYVRSGFKAVAEVLSGVENAYEKLWEAFACGKKAVDTLLLDEGIFSDELKAKCLHAYRENKPKKHELLLAEGAQDLLRALRERGIKTGIITDGRPEGQRAKIEALGLCDMVDEIIVTDELGGESFRKPDDISFRIMQKRLGVQYSRMVYVGDNAKKDLFAPARLGMQSILYINKNGLYSTEDTESLRTADSMAALAEMLL